uniref:Uncharacterized protein LOC113790064 n=1 Tax=Dermatophagoides pteronyssinus TaxID=6956 RepID=A0A6P6XU93_DERPT|nr:uncharacterized protein LOC113790064 [Dermatophagoides pteronyssinus]
MINRYQRRRPRRRIDIEHLNQDLEEFRRLNFIDSVPNDRSDDESSNEQQNRGRIPWHYRNGHANDQHEVPFDGLFDENNNRVEMPETHDSVDDLLEEEIINQY